MSSTNAYKRNYEWHLRMGERAEVRRKIKERRMAPYKVRETEGAQPSSFDLSAALNAWLVKHGGEMVQSCASCRHMTRSGPATCVKFNMTPPIDIITHGCPAYEDESDIPF